MRTLVIDSATEACSVALFEGADLLAGELRMLGRGHAEQLVPMIADLPERGRAQRIAVALGPGSFTGVRVGLAAAQALRIAWDAEMLGYPTLALVAAMARAQAGAVPLGVAMTGGHGEWFAEGFAANGESTRPLASLPPGDAAEAIADQMIAGNQAKALVDFRGFGEALEIWPDARAFAALPPQALTTSLAPIYGRAPDARLPGEAQAAS